MKITEEMRWAITDAAMESVIGNKREWWANRNPAEQITELVESIDEADTPCWAQTGRYAVYIAPVGKTNWDFKIFVEAAHAHALR